jgi:hypothetical protein
MNALRRVIDESGIDRNDFCSWLIEVLRDVLLLGPER